jgi:hypothetical protein
MQLVQRKISRTTFDHCVATDPTAEWIFVCDNLNTPLSVTLMMLVAILCGIPLDSLGKKGKSCESCQNKRDSFLPFAAWRLLLPSGRGEGKSKLISGRG